MPTLHRGPSTGPCVPNVTTDKTDEFENQRSSLRESGESIVGSVSLLFGYYGLKVAATSPRIGPIKLIAGEFIRKSPPHGQMKFWDPLEPTEWKT